MTASANAKLRHRRVSAQGPGSEAKVPPKSWIEYSAFRGRQLRRREQDQALGNYTFEHDADGNITRRVNSSTGQDRRFFWSAESRLDSVTTIGGDRVAYQYNAFGQPVIRKRNGTVERYWIYDGDNILVELDASFNRVAEYVQLGTDQPFALVTGATSAAGRGLARTYATALLAGDAFTASAETLIGERYDWINYVPVLGLATWNTAWHALNACWNP